jgi:ATP-dependent Zn protease
MVCEFGMSTLGTLAYRPAPGAFESNERGVGMSEATAQRVDEEVAISSCAATRPPDSWSRRHRNAVRDMAEQLLVVESLDADGIKSIIAASLN